MSDGANKGVTARRALETILGGKPDPQENPSAKEEAKARIEKAPDPCEGMPIWSRAKQGVITEDEAYSLVADAITRAFLHMVLEDPAVLHTEFFYPDGVGTGFLGGKRKDTSGELWDRVMARWPEFDNWVGGASGFQVGFAYSTVLFLLDKPYAGNPAIVVLGDEPLGASSP